MKRLSAPRAGSRIQMPASDPSMQVSGECILRECAAFDQCSPLARLQIDGRHQGVVEAAATPDAEDHRLAVRQDLRPAVTVLPGPEVEPRHFDGLAPPAGTAHRPPWEVGAKTIVP